MWAIKLDIKKLYFSVVNAAVQAAGHVFQRAKRRWPLPSLQRLLSESRLLSHSGESWPLQHGQTSLVARGCLNKVAILNKADG